MQYGLDRVTSSDLEEAVQTPLMGTDRRKGLLRNEEVLDEAPSI